MNTICSESRSSRLPLKYRVQTWIEYTGFAFIVIGLGILTRRPVALGAGFLGSALFSGVMAMAGFLFTARSFLIFKLNEEVYHKDEYRRRVASLAAEGGANADVYRPLEAFDARIGRALHACVLTLCLVCAASMCSMRFENTDSRLVMLLRPRSVQWVMVARRLLADAAMASVVLTLWRVFGTVESMNRNFSAIIRHWRDSAKACAPIGTKTDTESVLPAPTP